MDPVLFEYFKNSWKPNYEKFKYSGWQLVEKIDKDAHIIDVGCGFNILKPHFTNLYGIDPANECADECVSIEEFDNKGKLYDVGLCLGSINFGTNDTIEQQIEKTVSLIKKQGIIYWRQNPGSNDHPWHGVENIDFFPWSIDLNYKFAKKYNCEVVFCEWDDANRIYAEWKVL